MPLVLRQLQPRRRALRIAAIALWFSYVAITVPCCRILWRVSYGDFDIRWSAGGICANYWGEAEPELRRLVRLDHGPPGCYIDIGTDITDLKWWFRPPMIRWNQILKWFIIPHWILFPSITLFTAVVLLFPKWHHRGHCSSCDYDLTGNTSGICSECGTAIPKEQWKTLQKLAGEVKAATPASGK